MLEKGNGPCCSCCSPVSRRHFLGTLSLAAAGSFVGAILPRASFASRELGEGIELDSLRPKPLVRIKSAIVRYPPPYWLGWPGKAYEVEKYRRLYSEQFVQAAQRAEVQLHQEEKPLESDDAVNRFVQELKSRELDAVLVTLQHMGAWNWADRISQAGIPTIIFAPVGTAFTGHVLEISRRPGVQVLSSLETPSFEQAFRMVRAKKQFEESRLLVLAGTQRKETVLERLGTKVRYLPRRRLHELFAQMPVTEEVQEVAGEMKRCAREIVEPTEDDLLNAARTFTTAKRLLKDEGANGLTTDCLGMVSVKAVPTPPCMAASLFQDGGVTYGCEADLFGAISLMLTSYLFDQPGFMNDPVPETVKNVLIAAHCTCGTRLNGFRGPREPFLLRSHSESDLGVSLQVLWKVGQKVTLVRFQNPNELILDSGTVAGNVHTPPAGGCRTSFEIKMDRIEDARDVLGFHQVVFYGDHRREVEAFCQMYGIDVIRSPEKAPKRERR